MLFQQKCPFAIYDKLCALFYEFHPTMERPLVDLLLSRFDMRNFITWSSDESRDRVIKYFKEKVIPHKIEVLKAGEELLKNEGLCKSLLIEENDFHDNLLIHDLSKFSDYESFGYTQHNFKDPQPDQAFEYAWHHHKMNNPHHPEHWLNPNRSGELEVLPMPNIYILEMIADWIGAGRTYGSTLEQWLPGNFKKFKFHPLTHETVVRILHIILGEEKCNELGVSYLKFDLLGSWRKYRRKGYVEMRPYVRNEDLTKIGVSPEYKPETDMGMIARYPHNHNDQWYVSKDNFKDNHEEIS
jgi:hypothetical protein